MQTFKAKMEPAKPASEIASISSGSLSPNPPGQPSIDPASQLVEFTPAVPGRPETAPAFDGLRQVKNMPVVAGCIQTATRCSCQNQQGLDAGLDRGQCEAWLKNPLFDAYRDQAQFSPAVDRSRELSKQQEKGSQPDNPPQGNPAAVVPGVGVRGASL